MEKRKFAVIGLGKFGTKLVEEFYEMGLNVLAIDRSQEAIESIRGKATECLILDPTDKESLEKSGIKEVDVAIVGIGKDVEENILTTALLKEIGVKEIVARAASSLHARILKKVGANRTVFLEEDMAVRLAHAIHFPGVQEYFDLKGPWDLAELKIGSESKIIGKCLGEIRDREKDKVDILMIEKEVRDSVISRYGERINRVCKIPREDYVIQNKDILILFGEPQNLEKFIEKTLK